MALMPKFSFPVFINSIPIFSIYLSKQNSLCSFLFSTYYNLVISSNDSFNTKKTFSNAQVLHTENNLNLTNFILRKRLTQIFLKIPRTPKEVFSINPIKKIHAEKHFVRFVIYSFHSTPPFILEIIIFIHIRFPKTNECVHKIPP